MSARAPRRPVALALWALAIICLWSLVSPGEARAAAERYGVVTVDLRPEQGAEVPTHLCVISSAQGPRARSELRSLLEPLPSGLWRVHPATWGATDGPALRDVCEGPGGACVPTVSLPTKAQASGVDGLYAACTADALVPEDTAASEPRVAFVMLEHLEGSPPEVESLKLAGGVATVGVRADLRLVEVTARSLGGHYQPQRRSQRASGVGSDNRLIVLPLQPRCRWIEASLPHTPLRARDRARLQVRVGGEAVPVDRCVGPLHGTRTLRVVLPRVAPGSTGALELELTGAGAAQEQGGRFAARWDGPWPDRALELHATRIAFVWRPPPCVVPDAMCPKAQLDNGIECDAARVGDECRYMCPGTDAESGGAGATAIEPPLTVDFQKDDPRQRWSEVLTRVGQPLTSYAPGEPVYVHADIGAWEKDVPGARVDEVEILGADGSTRKFTARGESRLQIPLARPSCESLRYRVVGDRPYREGVAAVSSGEVHLAPPEQRARVMTFNILLVQGGSWAIAPARPEAMRVPVYFVGQLQIAANFRPRSPRFARLAGEVRLGGTLGQWGYFGLETINDDPRRVDEKLAWARFLVEPALVVDIVHPVMMSAGVAVGSSWPLASDGVAKTNRFALVVAPSLDIRFKIRKWLAFVAQGRVFFGETTVANLAELDGSRRELTTYSLTGVYGLLFSF